MSIVLLSSSLFEKQQAKEKQLLLISFALRTLVLIPTSKQQLVAVRITRRQIHGNNNIQESLCGQIIQMKIKKKKIKTKLASLYNRSVCMCSTQVRGYIRHI